MRIKVMFVISLILIFLIAGSSAENLATFADIPWETPINNLKQVINNKTGLVFIDTDKGVESETYPMVTYMQYPVYQIKVDFDSIPKTITIILNTFEVDKHATGEIYFFDDGAAADLLSGAYDRFGAVSYCDVILYNDDEHCKTYAANDEEEYPNIITDTITIMQQQGYKNADIQIVYTSTTLIYRVMDYSDPSLFGNTDVYFVLPAIQYTNWDLSKYTGNRGVDSFPIKNGQMIYINNF